MDSWTFMSVKSATSLDCRPRIISYWYVKASIKTGFQHTRTRQRNTDLISPASAHKPYSSIMTETETWTCTSLTIPSTRTAPSAPARKNSQQPTHSQETACTATTEQENLRT